jgi:hypothetical protein
MKPISDAAKLKTGKRGQKTELTVRSPLRRKRFAFDHSAIPEEEEKKEEEEEEEEEQEEEKIMMRMMTWCC